MKLEMGEKCILLTCRKDETYHAHVVFSQ